MYEITGFRYRVSRWTGKLVLQVHETPPNKYWARWRDATEDDIHAMASAEIALTVPKLRVVK